MKVAVAYAEAKRQLVLTVDVEAGATAGEAVRKSGILSRMPHLDLNVNKLGIFSKLVTVDQVLNEGDRVEIYRPALGKPPKKERVAKGAPTGSEDEGGEG
ncbi:MAG: RnfH family protein [Magnetococcales bacterium]|nr:RnfH family protein [Magnetococcales bacterium]